MKKTFWPLLALALLLTAGAATALVGCAGTDLRPDSLSDVTQPSPQEQRRGEALLLQAAQAQGMERWERSQTLSLEMTDVWYGLSGSAFNPWPDADMDLTLTLRTGSFDARADIHKGSKEGWALGLQSWQPYAIPPGGQASFVEDQDTAFILPALHYLIEAPYRALNGTVVSYAGQTTIHGVTYERVMYSWGSLEPSLEHDQYIAFIRADTGRMEKLQYTVRDILRFATGVIHYSDYRDVDGLLLPHKMVVSTGVEDQEEDALHIITVREATLDQTPPQHLIVDRALARPQDKKPGQP